MEPRLNDRENADSTIDRVLKIGAIVPDAAGSRYAIVTDSKPVYMFSAEAMRILESEWRDRLVARFLPDQVKRIELAWGNGQKVAFDRDGVNGVGQPKWKRDPKTPLAGFELARLNQIVSALSATVATRFVRHAGDIPAEYGLKPAKLTLRVTIDPAKPPFVLRLGLPGSEPNTRLATAADGDSGPVFLLPDVKWSEWIVPPGAAELPANPFGEQ